MNEPQEERMLKALEDISKALTEIALILIVLTIVTCNNN